jgi:hypothetical protein
VVRTRARTWDPLIKSPNNHKVYQQHTRKPSRLGTLDFICQLGLLQTKTPMPRDPFVREKFNKDRNATRKHAAEYFQRFPKERYQTEVERWRHLQSQNIEFTMKRLREPIEGGG